MVKYQIIYWRDIPAQVKVKAGRKRLSRPLSRRFMAAIDAAAIHEGKTSTEAYLEEWRTTDWQEKDGDAQTIADSLAEGLETAYPGDRVRQLVKQGGWESPA